jgi:geranylgeranyl diphosphate synthase type I
MDLKTTLSDKIKTIDAALDKALDVGDQKRLKKAMRHLPLSGGKRLRPVLAMVVADAVNEQGKRSIPFGLCLEIVHNFTLVHDDIMDRDPMRRGIKTVHVEFDEATAINAGDALFARGFEILTTLDVKPEILKTLVREVAEMVRCIGEGQQSDMDFEKRIDVTEDEYMKMIEQKTSLMFRMAARGGAMIASGTKEQIEPLTEYGRLLGLGFQLWDDVLALTADQAKLGKSVGNDIRRGKRTLIVVHAFNNFIKKDKEKLSKILGKENATKKDVDEIIELLKEYGSIEYAKNNAQQFAAKAKSLLTVLKESEHKKTLSELADYAVQREK